MTREPDFYKKLNQTNTRDDDTKTYKLFVVPIGKAKITDEIKFHPEEPVIKYHQRLSNSCCLGRLTSAFQSTGDYRAITALVNIIEESLTLQTDKISNRLHFSNAIMKNRIYIKGEQRLRYNLKVWYKRILLVY